MSYNTLTEFKESSVAASALSGLSDARLQRFLDRAGALLDGYLRKRYKYPLVSVSDDVKQREVDIATYLALKARGFNPNVQGDAEVRADYLEAIAWAEKVATGEIETGIVDDTPDDDEGGPIGSSQESVGWAAVGFPQNDVTTDIDG